MSSLRLASKGVTLIELIFVMAVMGVTMLGIAQLISVVSDTQRMAEDRGLNVIDKSLAIKYIQADLRLAMVSMGNVQRKDDFGRNFFDYYPDVPANLLTNPTRRITLDKAQSGVQEINFLLSSNVSTTMLYDPIKAYLAKPQNMSLSQAQLLDTAGTLEYKGLNYKDYLTNAAPEFVFANQLLLLRAPVFLRRTNSGQVDVSTPPSQPSYLVKAVSAKAFTPVTNLHNDGISSTFDMRSPLTGVEYQSVNDFFRKVPAVGGAYPVLMLSPVNVISYRLEEPTETSNSRVTGWDLYRVETFRPRSPIQTNYEETRRTLVATNVDKITFERRNLNLPLISFTMQMAEVKR